MSVIWMCWSLMKTSAPLWLVLTSGRSRRPKEPLGPTMSTVMGMRMAGGGAGVGGAGLDGHDKGAVCGMSAVLE